LGSSRITISWQFNGTSTFVIDKDDPTSHVALDIKVSDSGATPTGRTSTSPDYFNSKQFPSLSFKSTGSNDDAGYAVTGADPAA
jgi:polyisoprenoid-binding protein YceI